MDSITSLPVAVADASGAGASVSIATSLQAQVDSAQLADVQALFASVGLGSGTDSSA